ncbi:hypothetical protein, partial [Fredinandcohnia quinoae]
MKMADEKEISYIEKASRFTCLYFIVSLLFLTFYNLAKNDKLGLETGILLVGILLFFRLKAYYAK